MKISELIAYLEKAKEENGDINVEVQYRDEGGDFHGTDDCIYCETVTESDGKKAFIL